MTGFITYIHIKTRDNNKTILQPSLKKIDFQQTQKTPLPAHEKKDENIQASHKRQSEPTLG